ARWRLLDIAFESMKQKTGLLLSLARRAGQGGARRRFTASKPGLLLAARGQYILLLLHLLQP
ncbi:hypothetical protein A2U01_0115034, partial [Trifolium medium]|nr:hypothetical protein [Trifolium medium]